MRIKIITCHDVYNLGASLQAYALSHYLIALGHSVEIIDYKPEYLRHYQLWKISNQKYDHLLIKQAYLLAKLPKRIKALRSSRKKRFDDFTKRCLPIGTVQYSSYEQLKENTPEADLYIAGSDQIWNPLFENGKDPSFFLQFVPEGKTKISYAASFSVDDIKSENLSRIYPWLKEMSAISVRELSGQQIIESMGLDAIQVCDPVFLLDKDDWVERFFLTEKTKSPYIFVYDFDQNKKTEEIIKRIAKKYKLQIISVFPMNGADIMCPDIGPIEFLEYIYQSSFIISNSFHATAFALIFHKDFLTTKREENLNTRMRDILISVGLENRMICDIDDLGKQTDILWASVDEQIKTSVLRSKTYLDNQLKELGK